VWWRRSGDYRSYGELIFNRKDHKTGKVKSESEWIAVAVPPIVDAAVFDPVSARKHSRVPTVTRLRFRTTQLEDKLSDIFSCVAKNKLGIIKMVVCS